jgi:hypothetical protein
MAPPKLEKHFTMRIYLSKENIHDLGAMRNGPHRHIAAITRGFIKGEGLEAEILPGGADWVSVRTSSHKIPMTSDPTIQSLPTSLTAASIHPLY